LCTEHLLKGKARAIIANSGNANACTGNAGLENARETARVAAEALEITPEEVLVASTGVIGAQLNMKLLKESIPLLVKNLSSDDIPQAAKAIMTTDSFPKISSFQGRVEGRTYHLLGIAKGAGMIMPDMATMLCFILTDVNINKPDLKKALSISVESSFNRITVDGDTSTNDTVLILANGMAGNRSLSGNDYQNFVEGLQRVLNDLAIMIVKDGEGATKIVHIRVEGAATKEDALRAARTVANSNLVKTAFYGQDPNWGRIMGALGRSDIVMQEDKVNLFIDDILIVRNGLGIGENSEKKAAEIMKNHEFKLLIQLNQGNFQDRIITSDLTHEYVSINADYRT
jgi:glutamate N-acetyltransferase/amino-acid N-acetyltransferase